MFEARKQLEIANVRLNAYGHMHEMIHNDEPLSYFVVEQEPTPHLFNRPSTQPNQHSEPGNASVRDPSQQVNTFQKHQLFYLQPSISSAWKQFRDRYIMDFKTT